MPRWFWAAGIAFGLALAGYVGWLIAHPCLREVTVPCTVSECRIWATMAVGKVPAMTCTLWGERETTCTRCVERRP